MKDEHQHPNEYIITEKQVTQIQDEYPFTARDIRSRTHTPATVKPSHKCSHGINICEMCKDTSCRCHDCTQQQAGEP